MQEYRKLEVWKRAHAVALDVHRLTQGWPRSEPGGLAGQLRRAALSVPANIAEGCGRPTNRDFGKFLQIAIGSSVELEYHLEFAADAEIIPRADSVVRQRAIVEVRRMLIGLLKKVRADSP